MKRKKFIRKYKIQKYLIIPFLFSAYRVFGSSRWLVAQNNMVFHLLRGLGWFLPPPLSYAISYVILTILHLIYIFRHILSFIHFLLGMPTLFRISIIQWRSQNFSDGIIWNFSSCDYLWIIFGKIECKYLRQVTLTILE